MNEGSPITSVWKSIFYQLQQEAPKPIAVLCNTEQKTKPPYYGREFHGPISREEANNLLNGVDGRYLIRESWRGEQEYTLAIVYDDVVKNYKLYYKDGLHFVGEKRFETIDDLVADGLIFFHVETRGAHLLSTLTTAANYKESPYYQARYYTLKSGSLLRAHTLTESRRLHQHALCRDGSASAASCASATSSPDRASESERSSLERSNNPQLQRFTGLGALPNCGTVAPLALGGAGVHNGTAHDTAGCGITTTSMCSSEAISSLSPKPSSPISSPTHHLQPSVKQTFSPTLHHRSDKNCNHEKIDVRDFEKAHAFKTHNFKGLHWCDYCTHFLWGLIGQGVKCADCGFKAHRKCSERVPADCLPDMNYVKRSFGVDLTTLLKAQNRHVPSVLEHCLEELERRGLESEGLYRVAGLHDDAETIKLLFDKDPDAVDISPARYDDINTLSSVVKAYLRQLPIPLVSFDTYPHFLNAVRDDLTESQRLHLIHQSLRLLPPAHYQTLKFFVCHLNRVTSFQRINMMSAENLAIVLAPTVIRSPDPDPLKALAAAKFERVVVEHLIMDYHKLFCE